jgi:carboxyl-terminal processing protease
MLKVAKWIVLSFLLASVVGFAFALGLKVQGGGVPGIAPGITRSVSPTQNSGDTPDWEILPDIYQILNTDFVGRENLDSSALFEASINGMIKAINDPHTVYIDPESNKIGQNSLSGAFEGIGATVSQQGQDIVIVAPIRGSPAEAAGIKPGDVIVSVNGESTKGWSVNQAVLVIRGPRGSKVNLKIQHSDGKQEDYVITRDRIQVDSVYREPPTGAFKDSRGSDVTDLGYLYISEFTERTPRELEPILKDIASKSPKGLIIDMRANPGGLLNATVETADMFLDRGIVLIEVERDGSERTFNSRPGTVFPQDVPIAILVDKGSASGAEVLSAALKDNKRASVVIGESSFGKGTVNNLKQLSNGGALYVSIARWLTPLRQQIEGVGVKPDIVITPSDEDIDNRRDVQLFRAIDYLRGQTALNIP